MSPRPGRASWLAGVFALPLTAAACATDDATPHNEPARDAETAVAEFALPDLPPSLPPMVVPKDNPTTLEGARLGRALYYDKRVSPDGSRACATCHHQDRAFSSTGARGVLPHINLAWARHFLWDGHYEGTLEDVMRLELEDFFHTDIEKLREPDLERMYEAAFGTPEVTIERTARALAQFQRTLVSGRSRYDSYVVGDHAALDAAEQRGMALFFDERAECFHCHATALLTDSEFHNIGLDANVADTGRGAFTGKPNEYGRWKTPTLRNVELTAPYMHDDRFETLEQVVEHYSSGVVASDTLDTLIPVGGFQLSKDERADLVAFLRALTDEHFLTNPSLGPPEK